MIYWLMGILILLIAGLDQLSKFWVVHNMTLGQSIPALKGVFELHYVRNSGMAWSLFDGGGARWFFVVMTLLVFVLVIFAVKKHWLQGKFQLLSVAAVMGGALGNFIDRLLTGDLTVSASQVLTGEVVDMIRVTFIDFPVFNVADCFVTCGAILLMAGILFEDVFRKKKEEPHDLDG